MTGPQVTATKVAGVHRSARSTVCVGLPQPAATTWNKVVSTHARVQRLEMPRAESSTTISICQQRAVNNTPPWSNDSCFFNASRKLPWQRLGTNRLDIWTLVMFCFKVFEIRYDPANSWASCYFPWCWWLRHVERSRIISPHGWSSSTSINRDLTPRLIAPRDPISSNLTHWLVVVDTLISTLIFTLMTYLIILVIITIPITILPIVLWYVTPQVNRCSINFQQSNLSACCERERCGAPLIS